MYSTFIKWCVVLLMLSSSFGVSYAMGNGDSVRIEGFSVTYAGTYGHTGPEDPNRGTKINYYIVLVVMMPIKLVKQTEWLDGTPIMDSAYPSSQPTTQPNSYIYNETNYAHIPYILPFSLLGHEYKVKFEYMDIETNQLKNVQATTRLFTPTELVLIASSSIGTIGLIVYAILRLRKRGKRG